MHRPFIRPARAGAARRAAAAALASLLVGCATQSLDTARLEAAIERFERAAAQAEAAAAQAEASARQAERAAQEAAAEAGGNRPAPRTEDAAAPAPSAAPVAPAR